MFKDKHKLFLKSLFVQVLLNEEEMQMPGYKLLTNGKFNHHINSNPYLATIVSGFISKVDDLKRVEIFASISAFIGDDLFWNNLKPITLMVSLLVYIFRIDYHFLLIPFVGGGGGKRQDPKTG
jgi:mannose/fructose/N-acetylgalactosamine-specific phosphotransferase system component IID